MLGHEWQSTEFVIVFAPTATRAAAATERTAYIVEFASLSSKSENSFSSE